MQMTRKPPLLLVILHYDDMIEDIEKLDTSNYDDDNIHKITK